MEKRLWNQIRWAVPMTGILFSTVATIYAGTQSNVLLHGNLYGNIPNVTVRGVQAGAAPWVVQGSFNLTRTNLSASGKWLVVPKSGYLANQQPIPSSIAGTTVGITSVVAAITFANSPTIVTTPVPLSKQGDFKFNVKLNIPKSAADPVVLIGAGSKGSMGAWFASSNFLEDYGQYTAGSAGVGASGSAQTSGGTSASGSGSNTSTNGSSNDGYDYSTGDDGSY